MALPAGVETVVLSTGGVPLALPDGTPLRGFLRFIAPSLVTIAGQDVVFGGSIDVPLVDGEFRVTLVATDATGMNPVDWTYKVRGEFDNAPDWIRYILLPKATPSVVLADILVPDPVAGDYTVIVNGDALLSKSQNLADLPNKPLARTNLGLGTAAVMNVGTTAGTVMAGDDIRVAGTLIAANNLSDIPDDSAARTNLGLGGAATLEVGTTSGTVMAGDDGRIAGALQASDNLSDLDSVSSARGNLGLGNSAVRDVGTTAGTVMAGDDVRVVGTLLAANNLSDVPDKAAARDNMELGGAATRDVGTSAGTVAAGDDTRLSGAAQKTANLSDLASAETARTNLGLGTSAVRNVGTAAGTVAEGNDSRITGAAQKSANLSDLTNVTLARTSLGLGTSAVRDVGTTTGTVMAGDDIRVTGALTAADNLSDLTDVTAARTNLGLGDSAVRNVGTTSADVAAGNTPALAQAAAAQDATDKVAAHVVAVDPHGDRAWASGQFATITTTTEISADVTTLDGFVQDTLTRVAAIEQGTAFLSGVNSAGPVNVTGGNLTITDFIKGYRFRVDGSELDLEATGKDLIISTWSGSGFNGTQYSQMRMDADAQWTQIAGKLDVGEGVYGAGKHTLDGVTGVAALGKKNSLENIRLAGFKTTTGAPTTGTWVAGDVLLDTAGAWHLCTVGGTPGTWVTDTGGGGGELTYSTSATAIAADSDDGVADTVSRGDHVHAGVTSVNGADGAVTLNQGIFNAMSYGAVGNGIANDTTPIQNALYAARDAGGGTVIIPGGYTYLISSFLVAFDNTRVYAYGATLRAIGNTGLLRNFLSAETFSAYNGHSNIQIYGGTWDGNAGDGTNNTTTGTTNVMGFVHAKNILVRDATIMNVSSAHGMEFNAIDGGTASHCRFLGYRDNSGTSSRQFSEAFQVDLAVSGSASIGLFDGTPSKNITMEHCTVGPSATNGNFGRMAGSHTIAAATFYDNIRILNNTSLGTLSEGIHAYAWTRSVIKGNTILSPGLSGIKATVPNPTTAGYTLSPASIDIEGNTVDSAADESSIRAIGYATSKLRGVRIRGNTSLNSAGNGIHAEHCDSPQLLGNTARVTNGTGLYAFFSDQALIDANEVYDSASNAINVTASAYANVVANTVDGTDTNFGIFLGASGATSSIGGLVSGNQVLRAASAGIRLSTGAAGCTITGNKVRKAGAATTNAITFAADATDCTLVGNDFSGNDWSAATAIVAAAGSSPVTDYTGGTSLPGSNRVDTDVTPLPALEAAISPAGRYETTSRLRCGTESSPTSGFLYLVPVWLPKGKVISNLSFISGNTAATTPSNYWFALFNSSRVALARTADQTTAAWAASTTKTLAIAQTTAGAATSYTTTYAGLHYIGFMIAAATPPSVVAEGRLIAGATSAPGLGATNSGQTTPPTVTGGAFTAAAFTGAAILAYGYTS